MKNTWTASREWLNEIVGQDNRVLFFSWWTAVAVILLTGAYLSLEPISVLGVADSKEYQVNFDSAVEIRKIHVLPGQVVSKGDLLLELNHENLEAQLRLLKGRIEKLSAEIRLRKHLAKIVDEQLSLPDGADPLLAELLEAEAERRVIEHRLENLFVFAEIDGAVGAINFKNGELVSAFTPIVTLIPSRPMYVHGYLNESLRSKFKVGDKVEVKSPSGDSVEGSVASVGVRIVPIPERLLRIRTLTAWGREIVVQIPVDNNLLVGEKVSVNKKVSFSLMSEAQAESSNEIYDKNRTPLSLSDEMLTRNIRLTNLFHSDDLGKVIFSYNDSFDEAGFLILQDNGRIVPHRFVIQNAKGEKTASLSSNGNSYYLLVGELPHYKLMELRREGFRFEMVRQYSLDNILSTKNMEFSQTAVWLSGSYLVTASKEVGQLSLTIYDVSGAQPQQQGPKVSMPLTEKNAVSRVIGGGAESGIISFGIYDGTRLQPYVLTLSSGAVEALSPIDQKRVVSYYLKNNLIHLLCRTDSGFSLLKSSAEGALL